LAFDFSQWHSGIDSALDLISNVIREIRPELKQPLKLYSWPSEGDASYQTSDLFFSRLLREVEKSVYLVKLEVAPILRARFFES